MLNSETAISRPAQPHRPCPLRRRGQRGERRRELAGIVRGDEVARDALPHEFGVAADAGGDDRTRRRHRLEDGVRHALRVRGQRKHIARREQVGRVGAVSKQFDRIQLQVRHALLEIGAKGTFSGDQDFPSRPGPRQQRRGVQEHRVVLHVHQPPDRQHYCRIERESEPAPRRVARAAGEAVQVHPVRDHVNPCPVDADDRDHAARELVRDGEQPVHALPGMALEAHVARPGFERAVLAVNDAAHAGQLRGNPALDERAPRVRVDDVERAAAHDRGQRTHQAEVERAPARQLVKDGIA